MKAVVYDAPKTYAVTEVPTPQAGPGEVRVRVDQVGVCGTDVHIHKGDFGAVFPLTPGHELVGTIDAVGDGVNRFTIGDPNDKGTLSVAGFDTATPDLISQFAAGSL